MEKSKLPSPHNNYFAFALSHLPNAKSLLESQLPPKLLQELNLDTLEVVPGSFVEADLRDRHSDLLLSVDLAAASNAIDDKAAQRAFIYILLEHKSEAEPLTVLQLLGYVVRIWEKLVRDKTPLRPIVPLVVYHGESHWTVARQLSELIPVSPVLAEFQVQFGFPLLDLSQLADDQLPGDALLQSTLGLLKYGRSNQLAQKLRRILELLAASQAPNPIHVWIKAIGIYVMAVNRQIESDELSKIVESVFPTQIEPGSLADRLLSEGEARGMEKGMEKGILGGKIQTLQELLGEAVSERDELSSRSAEELETLVQELQSRLRKRDA